MTNDVNKVLVKTIINSLGKFSMEDLELILLHTEMEITYRQEMGDD